MPFASALTIYKEALDIVNKGAREGIYDSELAELTSDYIKQLAWEEVDSVKISDRESLLITQPLDENIEIEIAI